MIEYSRLYELLDLDASRRKKLDSIRIRKLLKVWGGTLKTKIKTTEVPENTKLYWSLTGDDIDSNDLVGGELTGSGKIRKGKLKLKHKLEKDLITEGDETLELKLFTDSDLTEQVGETKEIVIRDKSKSPVSSARLFGNSSDNTLIEDRGDDDLRGDPSVDYLYGGVGNNKSYGGIRIGNLYGGSGNDVFKLNKENGLDWIREFIKQENRVGIEDFNINKLEFIRSDKNLKVYLDQYKNDLLGVINNQNLNDGSISDFIF